MSYIHPSLKVVVPIALRRDIYNKALDSEHISNGLCLALPMLLWNLNHFLDDIPNTDKDWHYGDAKIAFPELTQDRMNYIGRSVDEDEARREVLKEMLNDLN